VNGRLTLALEGEDPTRIPFDVLHKRTREYHTSRRRQRQAFMEHVRVTGKVTV
jgi:hypothetical protein